MRVAPLLAPLLALSACAGVDTGVGAYKPDEDEDTGYTHDTSVGDTDDTDGDLDDDGFTVDEGDCDDDDFRVSPAREEDAGDDKDNDCDGRVDEEWAGLSVSWVKADGSAEILRFDTIGRIDQSVALDAGCVPAWIDRMGAGWVASSNYSEVVLVDDQGACTVLGDFSETDYGVWGVAAALDGSVAYAVTIDSLVALAPDGTSTTLATWTVSFEDAAAHELAAAAVAVDPRTGELGLFDYFGGFATWSEADGLVVHKKGDWEAPALYTQTGTHRDAGGWYAPGIDAETGAYGVYLFDEAAGDWVLDEAWPADADWEPFMLAIDGDSGDYYLTANGGWHPTVWRIVEGSGYAADFYYTESEEQESWFYGVVAEYAYE